MDFILTLPARILSLPIPLAGGIFLATLYFYYAWKHRNIPPGPRGLPFLGFAPFFGPNPQDTFLQLKKKYGKIFSIYMGPELTIVLNDYEAIRAAYVTQADVFLGRAKGFVFSFLSTGLDGKVHGVLLAEGEEWKSSRRFMLQTFRDLGMGKSGIQDRILEEAEYLCETFAKNVGQPFDPSFSLTCSVGNVVCVLCFGQRFDTSDPKFCQLMRDILRTAEYLAQAGPLQSYPILRFIPGPLRGLWKKFETLVLKNRQFTIDLIKNHKETYDENETRDYLDAFLHQQRKGKEADSPNTWFKDDDLFSNLRGFLGAGTDTTASTLYWCMLFMVSHPDVQAKVHQELDENIGSQRSIKVDDRVNLPYTEAVCREIQRLANVTPFGVLRANLEETTLLGYRIPKRCFIMPNFAAANMDPNLWPNPTKFDPERFLDANRKLVEPPFFMPFSIGKRNCVGESLARMEIFLFFSNVMQRFRLKEHPDFPAPPTNKYTTGVSCRPLPFKMKIETR